MPTILVAVVEAWHGAGAEGAWTVSIAQEETLQEVLAALDPDLLVASGVANAAVGGAGVSVASRVAVAGDRLRGLVLSSDRMVRWTLAVTGRDAITFRTEVGQPALHVNLPGSFLLAAGDVVQVTANNESDQGAASCSAAILWRNDA